MTKSKGAIAAVIAGVTTVAAIAGAVRRTSRLQDEARANGTHVPHGPYEAVVKRPLDAAVSAVSLVALSPVLAATAIAVRIKLGSPVVFTQERPGLNGEVFTIYKFRTMTDERDIQTGELLSDEDRLTEFGKWLRSTSLDELPEIANVFKGDMSIVGPRPLLVRYLPRYNAYQARRHEVRPGLTGAAQVNGRNLLSWEDKFNLDIAYADRVTFIGDCKIVAKTVGRVVTREGISSLNHVTMGEFMGNESSEECGK